MAKKKFYAVRKGLVPGVYTSWPECQQNINGFSGAEYKGFDSEEDAKLYMEGVVKDSNDATIRQYSSADAIAYVDGCFNEETGEYSYGVVIFFDGGEEHLSSKFSDPEMSSMRNVAGEIEGAKCAMKFCHDNGIKSIEIFYDYEGIEKWCTGAWQTKKTGTKAYKQFYNCMKNNINIIFTKVKAHSGNQYNDMTDALAKAAVGIDVGKSGLAIKDRGATVCGINKDDLESVFELLKEDFPDMKCELYDIPYGISYTLMIQKPNLQRLSVNFYETKHKIWISGRKEDLFNRLVSFVVELVDVGEIPDFLNTVYNMQIDRDAVETEFVSLLPHARNKMPVEVDKYLHQAVYNLRIDGDVYVANYLVEPAIRPLEAVLKIALKENDIPIRKDGQECDSFFVFKEKKDGSYTLKEEFIRDTYSREFLKYLGKCYTYYHLNRNTLFHWDDPCQLVDTTRILNSVAEANVIIRDTLALIDEYYALK